MTPEQVKNLIESVAGNGKVFTVDFIKRSNGELRTMNARLARQTQTGKVGGELPYNATDNGLLPVYDMQKKAYRMIALESVTRVAGGGRVVTIE